jgi:hypothetical protein
MSHDPRGGAPTGESLSKENAPEEDAPDSRDDDPIRALLKRSAQLDAQSGAPVDLLRGVQRRIRRRSKGKFFADGWSTGASRVSYALVAALMLLIVALAYFALGPVGISAP